MNNYSPKPAALLHVALTLFLVFCLSAFLATNFAAATAPDESLPDQNEFTISEQPLILAITAIGGIAEIAAYESGDSTDPVVYTEIREIADFEKIMENPAGFFRLVADIAMDSTVSWIPLGSSTAQFTGKFDGQGHTISGLTIQPGSNYVGLFGHTNGATLKNIRLEGVNINGGGYVGGLVGHAVKSTLVDCAVTGTVKGTGNYVGGLAGFVDGAILENLRLDGINVNGGGHVGGLVGHAVKSTLVDCAVTGTVKGTVSFVGGLVGHAYNNITVSNTYANCDVSGNAGVGGLVGFLKDTCEIYNSYAAGTISGGNTVGGLFGWASSKSSISNCYSRAEVFGDDSRVGGLVGVSPIDTICTNSYWDLETSGQIQSALGEGRTTAAMQSRVNYENWDFETIWFIREGQFYPILQWQLEDTDEGNEPAVDPAGFPPIPLSQYDKIPENAHFGFSQARAARFDQLKRLLADAEKIIGSLQPGHDVLDDADVLRLKEIYARAVLLFAALSDYINEEDQIIIAGGLAVISGKLESGEE